ncbi:MAG: efflux RND transporter permease subunit [Gemmatimonadetes bacterium]|nr:efflux RND transporter permease subunit [Gemmatimonadota bacterium]
MSWIEAAIRRPVTTVASVLAVVLLGSVSLAKLPVTLLPDVTLPVLTVRTNWSGAAAEEVSRLVAEPIEESVAATPGLLELRSVSRNGSVTTHLQFAWGTDMQTTVLNVRERLDNARSRLPTAADRPTLLTSDPGERPIAVLALTGAGDISSIARSAREVHARRLEQIAGIASVAVVGSPEDEIRIEVDPERMRSLGLTPDDIAKAVQNANADGAGGTIRRGQFRFSVRAMTEFTSPDEIAETPIGPPTSAYRLRDVATISVTTAEPRTMTRLDGAPGVGLVVYKDAGSNTVQVTETLLESVEQLRVDFPGITLTLVAAQAQFVSDALSNLGQEIVAGAILSVLVILLFLRDWRLSLAITLMVPLSVLVALVLLQLMDVTINILSLGGLALGVGLLVDNAIVVAEATASKREEGMELVAATIAATKEVSGPLIAGTLTTLLVFGPIVFVKGLAAALFRDLSLSVVTSVGASLILALTLMPVMIIGRRRAGSYRRTANLRGSAVESSRRKSAFFAFVDALGARLAHAYESGVIWSLDHKPFVIGVSLMSVALTVWVWTVIPKEILPAVEEGIVVAAVKLPEGTAIEETARQVGRIEDAAKAMGASGIYSRVGLATDEEILAGADPGTSATAQLLVPVPDGESAADFAEKLRLLVPDLAEGSLALDLAGQSEFGSLIGREGRLVRVEVTARTLAESGVWAERARGLLKTIPTLTDVRDAYASTQPIIEISLQRDRIAMRGVSIDQISSALQGALGGVKASELRETDRRTPITVRFAGAANENLEAALATPINGVPVGQFVTVTETRAPIEVVRVGQRPVSIVEGLIAEGGTERAERDVELAMADLVFPAGVTAKITGANAEQRRTTEQLSFVALLSAALMFLVLAGEFASFTIPIVVMLTVPLAAIGGIVFLFVTGQSINAVALIGIVVMIGMADNEAVVKLDAIRRYREAGHPLRDAILMGGRVRLRAIAMTSITTVTGVLPLLFNWGAGGALYQPLAAGVIGGSVTSLAATFFVLPVAYEILERRSDAKAARAGETS